MNLIPIENIEKDWGYLIFVYNKNGKYREIKISIPIDLLKHDNLIIDQLKLVRKSIEK